VATSAAEAFGVQTPGAKLLVFIYAAVPGRTFGLALCAFPACRQSDAVRRAGRHRNTCLVAVVGGAGLVSGAACWGRPSSVILKEILQSYLPLVFHGEGQLETHRVRHPAGGAVAAGADRRLALADVAIAVQANPQEARHVR